MPTPPPTPPKGNWDGWPQWPWSTKEEKEKPPPVLVQAADPPAPESTTSLIDIPAFVYDPRFGVLMAGAVGLTLLGGRVYARHLKRLSNAETMDPAFITKQRKIRGIVTSVGDSDDFHIYHIARPYWLRSSLARLPSKTRKDLKGETIHIRLAGMDAPELPHFGMPGQPHGPAAKDWLTSKILGKTVRCTIHKRDQYQRIVASVYYRPSIYWPLLTNLSLEMVRSGWGCVYTQAGAEYGKEGIDRYLKAQQEAQKKRRGMWADGLDVETPAEYKERMKKGKAAPRPK